MTRDKTIFNIRYSFHLETMHATLYNRLDKLLTFVQIMLGSVIFADYGNPLLFGALVTTISVICFVWQPGKAALLYDIQSKKMKELITKSDRLSDEELHSELLKAQESESQTLGLLRDAAHKRTFIALGRESESVPIKLKFTEKIISWFSGDLPTP